MNPRYKGKSSSEGDCFNSIDIPKDVFKWIHGATIRITYIYDSLKKTPKSTRYIYIYIRTTITIRPLGKNISISIIKKRKIFIFISGWTCWVIKRVEMYTFKDPNQSVLISVRCLVMGQWSGLSWSRTPRREERIQSLSERVNITFGKLYTSNFQTTTFLRVCY